VKNGDFIVKKEESCRNMIFFIAEGQYYITDNSKRGKIYGESCFNEANSTFKVEIKMKENGKIAWTTLEEVVKSFGCSINEAIHNSESISKMMEIQKHHRCNLHEIGKTLKLEELNVIKKLGEGQFGNVFLVNDRSKENLFALKCISKQ
jgi:cGMP-dependent protein kinase